MILKIGDKFPKGTLAFYESNSLKIIDTNEILKNKRVVIFGMPGAFTPTCSQYHIPSIIKEMGNFKEKGIDEILCLVVNDVYVANVWSLQTGAKKAGLKIVSDPLGKIVKKIGLSYSAPDVGFLDRSMRFCLILNNGILEKFFKEEQRGTCAITSGKSILSEL